MIAYDAARWNDFALAQLGASAALLGLVFVGLSINLRDFINVGSLVNRAAESIVVLGSVLVSATAVLIPAQSETALSIELIVIAVATLVAVARLQRRASVPVEGRPPPPLVSILIRRTAGLGAALLLLVAASTLLVEGGGGLFWWPAAIVAAYASALSNAWVLLIEILR
jgi:hypothetical protein